MKYLLYALTTTVMLLIGCCTIADLVSPGGRIGCIGTSITEDYTLPGEQTYPALLQKLVTSPDKVLNSGLEALVC